MGRNVGDAGSDRGGGDESHTYTIRPEDPLSAAIVYAVADFLDCDPLEMPELLYDAVSVDALEGLFPRDGTARSGEFSFRYCELSVTVDSETVVLDASADTDRRRASDESDGETFDEG